MHKHSIANIKHLDECYVNISIWKLCAGCLFGPDDLMLCYVILIHFVYYNSNFYETDEENRRREA